MKILLSKPGLDGHDVGVKVLAQALINAGFTIIYTGLRKSVEEIAAIAIKNNVDIIGLSILSGTHLIIAKRMREIFKKQGITIPWIVGGNIPFGDVQELIKAGAVDAFPTGTKIEEVVTYFKKFDQKQVK